jgi:hypothetical protein
MPVGLINTGKRSVWGKYISLTGVGNNVPITVT